MATMALEREVGVIDDEAARKAWLQEQIDNCPEVEYPPEFLAEFDRRRRIAEEDFARGEIFPQTVEELAAEFGFTLEELKEFKEIDD